MAPLKVAGAPITWGVCEVPDWGHQLGLERVLREMAELGLTATEAGPDGFLPADLHQCREVLERNGLALAAGFIPVVLHRSDHWPAEKVQAAGRIRYLAEAGADVAVIAASTGETGYEGTSALDDGAWDHLAQALTELEQVANEAGILLTVHPHYGTVIESPDQIDRFLAASDAAVCLDTGHVMVGGGDPVDLATKVPHRIHHVHLKDVDAALARRVNQVEVSYHQAVAQGLYRPLGEGDVDVATILAALDQAGFEGWLVLEQDTVLTDEPPADEGPRIQARTSLRFLEEVAAAGPLSTHGNEPGERKI